MSNLQIVKSAAFGEIQCDIYQDGQELFMTREQVGQSLEYSDPMVAIAKIHDRYRDRLNKFSFTKTVNGRKVYFYTRKGIMEICRHSNQPKADAFMDFVWDVMDNLMTGKTKLVPSRPRLGETNSAARIITKTLKDAGMSPQFVAVAVKSLYEPVGVVIPLDGITVDKKTFNATAIAQRLGMLSRTGLPHYQAVSAIISQLDIGDDEKELVPFQNQASGHSGPAVQYTESVIEKVSQWLADNNYPESIFINGKAYKVNYMEKSA